MHEDISRPTLLIVDDISENIDVLIGLLENDYKIKAALNGKRALKITAGKNKPDLILLDIMMPDMDGYEVCRRLKECPDTKNIPVIFVTAKGDVIDESKGFDAGCVDYITKPLSPTLVKARVKTHLALYNQSRILEEKVRERTRELVHTQDVTILGLAVLTEYRDNETGGHIIRTQNYVRILAELLAKHPRFRKFLDEEMVDLLFKSSPLHDIGKVGVPDSILFKTGSLTDEEFKIMKRHPIYGGDALSKSEQAFGSMDSTTFLRVGKEIAYTHHEKWDGTGYPYGLKGEDIPLSGRLMALADVYDALISKRVYKPPFSHAKAMEIITVGDGRVMPDHFDPDILEIFREYHDEFRQIALQYADHEEERKLLSGSHR
ncbi:two-component system response regulator [uncultured Desulfobacter sp.]|uniref:response regulator n=1 Tax=uncultured Desulfobacter sp. TaxID=240139 RepID=UPI002AAAF83A|nr:two-component system response regulator [uncultured Desulfobacter sp.]